MNGPTAASATPAPSSPPAAGSSSSDGAAEAGAAHRAGRVGADRWHRPARVGLLAAAVVVVTTVAVGARVWPRSALWLDEAQSIAFAREPLTAIPAALRTDGAPPLYYLLLHGWMRLFGRGDHAVRALSAVVSVVTLPVFFLALRRLGGTRFAAIGLVLLAVNPFAIRYATETRMYALVVFLVAVGLLAVPALVARATTGRVVAVAAVVGALLWTHYWAIYLVGALVLCTVAVAVVAWRRRDRGRRDAALRVLLAVGLGGVAWLPWAGSFRYQARHTGTPWTTPPNPLEVFRVVYEHAGGRSATAIVLGTVYVVAVLAAVLAAVSTAWVPPRWLGRRLVHGLRPFDALGGPLAAIAVLAAVALPLAVAGAITSGSAFAARYTSVFLPLTLLLVAAGLDRLRSARVLGGVLAVVVALSLTLVVREIGSERTPARTIATVLAARAQPGDVVVFCPDQVGPAVARELARRDVAAIETGTFPRWAPPDRVDWVDYAARVDAAWPAAFAFDADDRAGTRSVWLVWSDGYPPTEAACRGVRRVLERVRPGAQLVVEDQPWRHLDHAALLWFPPSDRPRPPIESISTEPVDPARRFP